MIYDLDINLFPHKEFMEQSAVCSNGLTVISEKFQVIWENSL